MQRHLLYHLCPFTRNAIWRENVAALLTRLSLFNGRRLIAVGTGAGLESPAVVLDAFAGAKVEFVFVPNDPNLREGATFLPLFERVADLGAGHAVLWAHAKGVQTPFPQPVALWRQALYELYLDYWPLVEEMLEQFPVVGAFKKTGPGWNATQSRSAWHYSGSWCWYRACDLFSKDWRRIEPFPHALEAYPSLHFPEARAGCLFWEAPVRDVNLYSVPYWQTRVSPALVQWKKSNEAAMSPPAGDDCKRVELGGGKKPRPGFVNVDLIEGADVCLDLQKVCDRQASLPWPDGTVDEVYTSHCFEHLTSLHNLLWEIVRICRVGARVEIRVPHWNSDMAHCDGHKHAWSETQVRHLCHDFIQDWWSGSPKRLKHLHTKLMPGNLFALATKMAGGRLTPDEVMRLFPDACHECRFHFEVIPHAG